MKFSPDAREYKSLHLEPVLVVLVGSGYQQNLSTLQSKSDRQLPRASRMPIFVVPGDLSEWGRSWS